MFIKLKLTYNITKTYLKNKKINNQKNNFFFLNLLLKKK